MFCVQRLWGGGKERERKAMKRKEEGKKGEKERGREIGRKGKEVLGYAKHWQGFSLISCYTLLQP